MTGFRRRSLPGYLRRAGLQGLLAGLLAVPLAAVAAESPIVISGLTEAINDVVLGTPVAGIVSSMKFREGDLVKAGEVILELDKQLEELEVERRKQVMDLRKRDFDTTRVLFDKTGNVPKEELEKKEVDYTVARVEHQMSMEQLRRRLLIAPHDGVITDRLVKLGQAVDTYQPMIRLVDPTRCRFQCYVEAKVAARLKLDQTVLLEIDNGAKRESLNGRIAFLSPVADGQSALITVKAHFDNLDGRIKPGLPGVMIIKE